MVVFCGELIVKYVMGKTIHYNNYIENEEVWGQYRPLSRGVEVEIDYTICTAFVAFTIAFIQ